MNPKEILHADLLDIVFDNRNKSYGAYALRKFYEGRLMKATAAGIGLFISISLCIQLINPASPLNDVIGKLTPDVIITPTDIPKDLPVEEQTRPTHQQPPTATTHFTSDIQLVDNNVDVTDVPTVDALDVGLIDNVHREGANPTPGSAPVDPQPTLAQTHEEKPTVEAIQRQPEFPGGKEAWSRFLSRYLRVPEELGAGEKKTVLIRFLVSEDGSITQFTVVQSGGEAFDNEVIRVLKKMPKWNPAIQNGRNITVTFTQPVTFQSVEE